MSTSIRNAMKRDNDELYTPKILVDVIMPFVENYVNKYYANWSLGKPTFRIWCPFDKENSEFVIALKEKFKKGVEITHSHISEPNGDFFEKIEAIGHVELVLSNPPFSRKLDIIKTLNNYNITWCLCMNLESLNYQIMGNYFADHPISLIIPDKKISFDGHCSSFNTRYFCSPDFLADDYNQTVTFVHCEHNNQVKCFVPSRMYESK